MANYSLFFSVSLLVNAAITFRSSGLWKRACRGNNADTPEDVDPKEELRHRNLLRRYLIVYLLATLSDWLQGPYVYALYDAYGFSQHDIAILFVAGFASSMVFGSFVGGMADWGGRRRFVILFSITYALSCLTKRKLCVCVFVTTHVRPTCSINLPIRSMMTSIVLPRFQ